MKTILIIIFAGLMAIVAKILNVRLDLVSLFILGFATIRLARTISFNGVGEPFRKWFTKTRPDSCGAGMNVEPAGTGLRYVIGELISCPICSGTWSALIALVVWAYVPTVIYVLAIAGVSEMFHWLFEFLEWQGRAGRVVSGCLSPDRQEES